MSTKPKNLLQARQFIVQVLIKTLQGYDLQFVLNQALSGDVLQAKDARLVTQICYGYLRYKGWIDFVLSRLVISKKRKDLPFRLFLYLGLGIYELFFLDKVPQYATVNWYVEAVKRQLSPRHAGLTNAVLRSAARRQKEILSQEFFRYDSPSEVCFLSRYFSCPQWIVTLWLDSYGYFVCRYLLESSLQPPCLGLRINLTFPESTTLRQSLNSSRQRLMSLGGEHLFVFDKSPLKGLFSLEEQGLISRQSPWSFQGLLQGQPKSWPLPVWDACAGHGGKTGALMEMGLSSIWASDLSWNKVKLCQQELHRLALPSIPAFVTDLRQNMFAFHRSPGTVLLDVPCTGLGVLSRRPDIKWKRDYHDIERLKNIQSQMLRQSLNRVAAGGKIIYMTCTLNPGENQEQIQGLLEERPGVLDLEFEWTSPFVSPVNEFFYMAVLLVSR